MKTYEEGFIAGFSHNIKTVEELEERIKKAIKYIQDTCYLEGYRDYNIMLQEQVKELLEILKGNEK